jgi:hypothetical protein
MKGVRAPAGGYGTDAMPRRLLALAVACCGALLVPAPPTASAREVLVGSTAQSRPVVVTESAQGRVTRMRIALRARCRRGSLRVTAPLSVPRRASRGDRLDFIRIHGSRQRGGIVTEIAVAVRGRRATLASDTQARAWRGQFAAIAEVRRRGRLIDRCRLGRTAWAAATPLVEVPDDGSSAPAPPYVPSTPPPAPPPPPQREEQPPAGAWKLEMRSDSGDYIGQGQTWSHSQAADRIRVSDDGGSVRFSIDTADGGWWYGTFAAPPGQQLAAQRYTDARRAPFADGHPGLEVTGNGRGCNQLTGEFTVRVLERDANGTLRRFVVDFEQHCEGGEAALRGTFEFTHA